MTTAVGKEELRRRMRGERELLPAHEHVARSLRVQERFVALERFAASASVALYAPIRGEVRTDLLFERAKTDGKTVLFPKLLAGAGMGFFPVEDLTELEAGSYGISEPSGAGEPVPPQCIDLMAVPGVAFDAQGNRLGYGGGYFDRLLDRAAGRPRWAAGIAFDFQIVPEVPVGPGDRAVDQVVTECRSYSPMGD